MSDWDGMEDAWLDGYWEERLSGPDTALDFDYVEIDRLEDLDDFEDE